MLPWKPGFLQSILGEQNTASILLGKSKQAMGLYAQSDHELIFVFLNKAWQDRQQKLMGDFSFFFILLWFFKDFCSEHVLLLQTGREWYFKVSTSLL